MRRFALVAWLLLTALPVAGAHAADGTIVINSGGVGVSADADARCSDPPAGDIENPFAGDDVGPSYSASVTADVSVPCQHSGAADNHTATGSASASGNVSTWPYGTIVNASGTVSASGHHLDSASGHAEFELTFTIENAPVDYRLGAIGEGRVELDGASVGPSSGLLQPGGHTIRGLADCSASSNVPSCAARSFTITLELALPDDTDGDGLFDVWETDGVDEDGDGTPELDLPAMGAEPDRKDIFVEIDHMNGHPMTQAAVDRVVAAFADAPVSNPDGSSGIVLHVDNGTTSIMDPTTGAQWSGASRAEQLVHQDVLGAMSVANPSEYDWSEFDTLKASHLDAARAHAFHYLISAHRHGRPTNSSSGVSREIGASDLIVSLGSQGEFASTVPELAGTFMHELGHNLGLKHGGDDHGTYEPNRLSVMNYAFQFTGIPRLDGTDVLDYARLAIPLNELSLDEGIGFGFAAGTQPAEWLTIYRCQDLSRRWAFLQAAQTDWNCDGTPQGVVARDFNRDGSFTALEPFQDWPNLVYHGGAIGGAGVALPDETELIEPPVDELLANAAEVAQAHTEAPTTPKLPTGNTPGGGDPGPSGGGQPGPDAPPVLSGLRLAPRVFPATGRGPSTGKRGGAALRFEADRAGLVRFGVERVSPGRRVRGRCVPARRGVRGRRCKRVARLPGSFTLPAAPGANSTRFLGRLRGRALPAGEYRLVATPLSAVRRLPGTPRRVSFRTLR